MSNHAATTATTNVDPPGAAASNDRVPGRTKIAFGLGAIVDNLAATGVHQLANPIYNIVLGINPAIIGTVLAAGRLFDAITDPIIGGFSDNFRSRFGRRRPLIVAGAILTGLMFGAMFFSPRGWSTGGYIAYLAGTMTLFYLSFTLYSVPLKGFQYELTRDYHERTRVSGVVALLMPIGGIASSWLFALSRLPVFSDPIEGVRWTLAAVFLVIVGVGILPALMAREHAYAAVQTQKKIHFRENFGALLRNKPLLLLSLAGLSTLVGIFTVYGLGQYLNIYYVHAGDVKAAALMHGGITSAYQIASMISAPLIAWSATRFGKRRTFVFCLAIALVGTAVKWLCYTPANPALMFVPMSLMGVGMSGFWVLVASMMADVSDHAEYHQGFRNEATVGAVFSWIYKSGLSLAFLLSGFVLVWVGFNEKLGGAQTPETILGMRLLFSFVPAAALLIAIVCIWAYPITEESAKTTRHELALRRGGT
jgi:glycoside/pentoside/hexuronide:cation symporter, GPH family